MTRLLHAGLEYLTALTALVTLLPAQSFSPTASGQLYAYNYGGPPQSYSGPITASTTTVNAGGPLSGFAMASATLMSTSLTANAGVSASGSASVAISLNLQGPVGAGVRVQLSGSSLSPVPGSYSFVIQGQQISGPAVLDFILPPGGLPISVNASTSYSGFYYSSVDVDVSWSYPGVSNIGGPTPGCLGPAVAWTQGIPRLGNTGFGFTCQNAHPFLGAVSCVGLGGLSTPIVYDFVNVWLDPSLPLATIYLPSDASGDILHPLPLPTDTSYLGLSLYSQFLVMEPGGCMPLDLSGSNATKVTLQL